MTLEMLLENRFQWQNNTLERMEKQLSCRSEGFSISEHYKEQENWADMTFENIIATMNADSDEYARQQIAAIDEKIQEIQEQIKAVAVEIEEREKLIPEYDCMLANNKEAVSKYRFVRDSNIHFSIKEYKNRFIKSMNGYLGGKRRDAGKKLSEICENQIKMYISDTLQQTITGYIGMGNCEELYQTIIDDIPIDAELEKIVSPAGWISMFDKVYRIKCSFMTEEIFIRIEKKLNSIYKMKKAEYLKQNKKIKDEYDNYLQLRKQCNRDTEQGRNEIVRLNEVLQDELEERLILAKNREKDQEWLKNYAAISVEEFAKQKNQLMDQLDSLPPDEKISTLLFIALLEKDFNNIIGNEVVC